MNGTTSLVARWATVALSILAVAYGYGSLSSTVSRMEAQLDRVSVQSMINTSKLAELGAKIDIIGSQTGAMQRARQPMP